MIIGLKMNRTERSAIGPFRILKNGKFPTDTEIIATGFSDIETAKQWMDDKVEAGWWAANTFKEWTTQEIEGHLNFAWLRTSGGPFGRFVITNGFY